MPFTFTPTAVTDVVLVESRTFSDHRGWFSEGFKASEFASAGLPSVFAQDNRSRSHRGVVRGLHFQRNPMAQGKLVTCGRGAVWDVAVDIRVGSPTYGRWVAEELTEDNGKMLWIPGGFAHGFAALTDAAELVYKCTQEYSGPHDGGVKWDDPAIGITWPVDVDAVIVSDKDRDLPLLAECDHGFTYSAVVL
jgi:dTDP-4-dehydrorhamnose 3,5-epimerase